MKGNTISKVMGGAALGTALGVALAGQAGASSLLQKKAGQGSAGKEMLQNGDFKAGMKHWKLEQAGAKGETTVGNEGPSGKPALRLKVLEVGDQSWRLQLHQSPLKITKGKMYLFEFWAKAARTTKITVNCMQNHAPWEHHGAATEIEVGPTWKKVSFPFTGPWTDDNARVTMTNLGTVVGQSYWFAACSLKEVKK